MLKIVAIVAVVIVALVAGVLAYAATRPGSPETAIKHEHRSRSRS